MSAEPPSADIFIPQSLETSIKLKILQIISYIIKISSDFSNLMKKSNKYFITCNRCVFAAFFCLLGKINFAIVYTPFSWKIKEVRLSVASDINIELQKHKEATKQYHKLVLKKKC